MVSKVPLNSCHFHLMRLHLECGYTHRNGVMCPCPYLGWGAVNLTTCPYLVTVQSCGVCVCVDAYGLSPIISPSLQNRTMSHTHSVHCN